MSFAARIALRSVGRSIGYRDYMAHVLTRDSVAQIGVRDEPVSLNQRAATEKRNGVRTGFQMRGEHVLPNRSLIRPPMSPYNGLTIH